MRIYPPYTKVEARAWAELGNTHFNKALLGLEYSAKLLIVDLHLTHGAFYINGALCRYDKVMHCTLVEYQVLNYSKLNNFNLNTYGNRALFGLELHRG